MVQPSTGTQKPYLRHQEFDYLPQAIKKDGFEEIDRGIEVGLTSAEECLTLPYSLYTFCRHAFYYHKPF